MQTAKTDPPPALTRDDWPSEVRPDTSQRPQQLRLSPWLAVTLSGLLVAVEQALEHVVGGGTLDNLTLTIALRRLVLPVLIVYMLIMLRVLRASASRAVVELRPVVRIADREYDDRCRRMHSNPRSLQLVLLLVSAGITFGWFLLLRYPFPVVGRVYLPDNMLLAAYMLLTYILVGWVGLRLVSSTLQVGRELGALAESPLEINLFDPRGLLPFGRLALVYSLSVAGVIIILLIGLGQPTELLDWAVILIASLGSLGALILPLRGVHRQMDRAKETALGRLNAQLRTIYDGLVARPETPAPELDYCIDETNILLQYRRLMQEATTWPFQDAVTLTRAVLIGLGPLIYFVLTELIRLYLLPVFSH